MAQNHVKGGDTRSPGGRRRQSGDVVAVGKVGAVALTSATPKDDNNFTRRSPSKASHTSVWTAPSRSGTS